MEAKDIKEKKFAKGLNGYKMEEKIMEFVKMHRPNFLI